MADIRSLEHPTLKVPYESLNKRFRSAQKTIERELSHVNNAVNEAENAFKESEGRVHGLPQVLGHILNKIDSFETKLRDSVSQEQLALNTCNVRVEHLRQGCIGNANNNSNAISSHPSARFSSSSGSTHPSDFIPPGEREAQVAARNRWKRTRLDRMLVEHFLRSGFYDSAIKLANAADISDLTNINIFLVAKEVESALRVKDTTKILAWCHDNKSKMRKIKSNLEFKVRLQEFVELIKQNKKMDAVKHARKHFTSVEDEQVPIVQRAMALLAFAPDTDIPLYKEMFRESRWQELIEQFRQENYRLFQLSSQSVFSVALQVGLSALKTQKCSCRPLSDRNNECPVCQVPLNELAAPLPYAHCSQSRLICYISGKPLNEHNHPMMLPNGFVYGEHSLLQMSMENDGQIVCPRTKEIFSISDAEKIYVM